MSDEIDTKQIQADMDELASLILRTDKAIVKALYTPQAAARRFRADPTRFLAPYIPKTPQLVKGTGPDGEIVIRHAIPSSPLDEVGMPAIDVVPERLPSG